MAGVNHRVSFFFFFFVVVAVVVVAFASSLASGQSDIQDCTFGYNNLFFDVSPLIAS